MTFTILAISKCRAQWHSVPSQYCVTITTTHLQSVFITPSCFLLSFDPAQSAFPYLCPIQTALIKAINDPHAAQSKGHISPPIPGLLEALNGVDSPSSSPFLPLGYKTTLSCLSFLPWPLLSVSSSSSPLGIQG